MVDINMHKLHKRVKHSEYFVPPGEIFSFQNAKLNNCNILFYYANSYIIIFATLTFTFSILIILPFHLCLVPIFNAVCANQYKVQMPMHFPTNKVN